MTEFYFDHNKNLHALLQMTQRGPVFGRGVAFGDIDEQRAIMLQYEADAIHDELLHSDELQTTLQEATPDMSDEDRQSELADVLNKTVAFIPALTVGELDNSKGRKRLISASIGFVCMYLADQWTDRDDQAMLLAIEEYTGQQPDIPAGGIGDLVQNRKLLLRFMSKSVRNISEDDGQDIEPGFSQLVLGNEARVFRYSQEYYRLGKVARKRFLDRHAVTIAELQSSDAGFPTVTESLHASYRADDPSLPSIRSLQSSGIMTRHIQVCNTVARVADERGDWWMDMGNDETMGVKSINPFNEYHRDFAKTFCRMAGIEAPEKVAEIDEHFKIFSKNDERREEAGKVVTNEFFEKLVRDFDGLHPRFRSRHKKYLELSKRTTEIANVNMLGDIALSQRLARQSG